MTPGPGSLHALAVELELGLAAITFVALVFVAAPYGRHMRAGFGPTVPARFGWVAMEAPAALGFLAFFLAGAGPRSAAAWALAGLWELHYLHRAFVYPFQLRAEGRRMPVLVVGLGVAFNVLNAFVNGAWVGRPDGYSDAWLVDPRLLFGAALFLVGRGIHRRADHALAALRRPGGPDYVIPRGGLFERVSCPNYLGEIVEWLGWALATWSLAGLSFALYTIANLAPRARAHHAWYRARFGGEYPAERRALVPYLW